MKTSDFDYYLPPELIAQSPLKERDSSRLMVLDRGSSRLEHRRFRELADFLRPADILVANDSRVFPARLFGRKAKTGGRVEILLLEQRDPKRWFALVGGKKLSEGTIIRLEDKVGRPLNLFATVTAVREGSQREVCFDRPLDETLDEIGHAPLPPYIHEKLDDPERYQTVYSRPIGSAAAPTAGLHFTADLLISLRELGVHFETVTLHIGLDTFKPVTVGEISGHPIHSEWFRLTPQAARRINQAKLAGGRVVAIGTTTVRVLETAALRSAGWTGSLAFASQRNVTAAAQCPWRPVSSFAGRTDLFIYPGYRFLAVDGLITNFHLPRSTLLMLVSAFAGKAQILAAYQTAIEERYRFYSFGDAMLII